MDHCLRAFTTEEKLEETYHCGHCKGKQPATKKLQIWKLPPILIVHLKRFNFVNNKWVKSQKVVNFPFKNFDPTPYLASVPQETILRHKELLEHGNATTNNLTNGISSVINNSNIELDTSISEITPEHSIMSYSIKEVDNIDTESSITDINIDSTCEITTKLDEIQSLSEHPADISNSNVRQANISTSTKLNNSNSSNTTTTTTTSTTNNNNNNSSNTRMEQSPSAKASAHPVSRRVSSNNATMKMRKRLASTSLTKSPVIDGAFVDHHNHHLDDGQDPFDLKYKLYAVVVSCYYKIKISIGFLIVFHVQFSIHSHIPECLMVAITFHTLQIRTIHGIATTIVHAVKYLSHNQISILVPHIYYFMNVKV